MLEMRLGRPNVARSVHARVAGRLGKRPFNPTSRPIHVTELGRLLTCPSGVEHLVAFWREAHRHAPPRRLRLGAVSPEWTGLAGPLSGPDAHDPPRLCDLGFVPGDAPLR